MSNNSNSTRKNRQESRKATGKFVDLGGGKTGGFTPGIPNGPAPRTSRGERRTKVNWNKAS